MIPGKIYPEYVLSTRGYVGIAIILYSVCQVLLIPGIII